MKGMVRQIRFNVMPEHRWHLLDRLKIPYPGLKSGVRGPSQKASIWTMPFLTLCLRNLEAWQGDCVLKSITAKTLLLRSLV